MSPFDGAEPTATIVVRRPEWSLALGRDALRAYVVLVDGKEVGKVRRRGSLELRVPEGRHTVRATIDWTGSPAIDVDAAAGMRVVLDVQPAGSALRFDQLFGSTRYLQLELASCTAQGR